MVKNRESNRGDLERSSGWWCVKMEFDCWECSELVIWIINKITYFTEAGIVEQLSVEVLNDKVTDSGFIWCRDKIENKYRMDRD